MKNKITFFITVCSAAVLLCLGIMLVALGEGEDRASDFENRMLQGKPELSADNVFSGNYSGEFENFLSDGFFGRNLVINASESFLGLFSAETEEDTQLLDDSKDELQGAVDPETPTQPDIQEEPVPGMEDFDEEEPEEDIEFDESELPEEGEELEIIPGTDTYGFSYIYKNGTLREYFRVSDKQISQVAHALNAYKSELPEDGNVFYMMVPLTHSWEPLPNSSKYAGWYSNTEGAIQEQVDEGVHIINIPEILNPHLTESIYFPIDHHWSALGAWYAYEELMNIQGIPAVPYDEYSYRKVYTYKGFFDVMNPLQAAEVNRLYNRTTKEKSALMNYREETYMAYVTGVIKPWTKIETGFSTGRKALVIGDSFANVFTPYLCPHYDEVHMTDVRQGYYYTADTGGWIADLMEYHGIDDVYIVMSYANDAHTDTSCVRLEKCLYG